MLLSMAEVVERKVEMTDSEADELWELLQAPLEQFFGCPQYRHYN